MTNDEIKSYEAEGWRFEHAVQPDPRSGCQRVYDTIYSPRIKYFADLDDPMKMVLEREHIAYARKLTEEANPYGVERAVRELLLTNPTAKKAVITVTLE